MPKDLKLKTGKFMVLHAPVKKHGTTKKKYVDVRGNGRMYNALGLARSVASDMDPETDPTVVMILETLRDGRVLNNDGEWVEE